MMAKRLLSVFGSLKYLLLLSIIGGSVSASASAPGIAFFASPATVSPASLTSGQSVDIKTIVTNLGTANNYKVYVQIYSNTGSMIYENGGVGAFSFHQAKQYNVLYSTPKNLPVGQYTVSVTVCNLACNVGYLYKPIGTFSVVAPITPTPQPVLNSTSQTRQSLIAYLNGLMSSKGHQVLSGQHLDYWPSTDSGNGAWFNFTGAPVLNSQTQKTVLPTISGTGVTPAILGVTLSANDGVSLGQGASNYGAGSGVEQANQWLAGGGIVMVSQWSGNPQTGGNQNSNTGSLNADELLTPGTSSYIAWHNYLSQLASALKRINGPVIFRPFIEQNGSWFWWNSNNFTAAQFIQLYQQMHDFMTQSGVTNLVWMYNVNIGTFSGPCASLSCLQTYYPGTNYVDIVGIDAYPPANGDTSTYDSVQGFAADKPIIYAEAGNETSFFDWNTMIGLIQQNTPKIVGVVTWCQHSALSNYSGLAGNVSSYLNNPSTLNLKNLPFNPP